MLIGAESGRGAQALGWSVRGSFGPAWLWGRPGAGMWGHLTTSRWALLDMNFFGLKNWIQFQHVNHLTGHLAGQRHNSCL